MCAFIPQLKLLNSRSLHSSTNRLRIFYDTLINTKSALMVQTQLADPERHEPTPKITEIPGLLRKSGLITPKRNCQNRIRFS
jgi:hypothetical protein